MQRLKPIRTKVPLRSKHYILLSAYKTKSQVHSLEGRDIGPADHEHGVFLDNGSITVVEQYDEVIHTHR